MPTRASATMNWLARSRTVDDEKVEVWRLLGYTDEKILDLLAKEHIQAAKETLGAHRSE